MDTIKAFESCGYSPVISIIIPCYDNAPHLPKCIESVLSQSFGDFELLLLNDGSTDTTLNICEDFQKKDARIKVYSHENKGVSYTRNRGITLALHDYIVFIDADDFIKIDYIERLSASYVDRIWPICGFINAKANKFTENVHYKKLLKIFPTRKITKENFLKLLEFYSLSSPCARMYCKKIIIENNIKFDKNITYQEDLLFN